MNEEAGLRLDKWLWHARFFRTRDMASKVIRRRKVRLNTMIIGKTHQTVRPGDVLTFPQGNAVRVVRVLDLGQRRGPADMARNLYEDVADRGGEIRAP